MISGIYQIICTLNGRRYIGSSNNIVRRSRMHVWKLQKGKHHSKHLQRAWNKYGEVNFTIEILERASICQLEQLEQWYIDNWKPEYNDCQSVASCRGIVRSPEVRKKISEALKGHGFAPETLEKCH